MTTPALVSTLDLDGFKAGDPTQLIDQVTADVRSYCRWHVTPSVTETIVVDGTGSQFIMLPSLHVTDVAAVVDDGVTLADTDFEWSSVGQLARYYAYWTSKRRAVSVTLTHGYDSAPDLAGVILAKVARLEVNPRAATRQQAGPFSEQYDVASGFTADEQAVLDRYRLPPRP